MARATGSPRAGAAPRSPLRRSRAAALLALCASLPACAASPAPPTVTVAARGDAVLTRGAIDAAVASGTAARACSGAWALSPARELHLELPRPRAHAARAGEAPHAGPHVLSIQGVPQDATRFADDFEVVYTDPSGAVVHRNATPPAYHFTLQSADRQWEGLFVLTDHMHVDHLYAWLSLAADGGEPHRLTVEPVLRDETTEGVCPPGEFEHVVFLDGDVGLTGIESFHAPEDDDVAHHQAAAAITEEAAQTNTLSVHARRLLSDDIMYDGDMAAAAPDPPAAPFEEKVTELVPIPPFELLQRAGGCYIARVSWEADASMQKLHGGGTVGKLLAATSGMNPLYSKAGISCTAGKVVVSGSNYPGTINSGLLKSYKASGARVTDSSAVTVTLATANKGGGPVVGRAYVGTACKGANYGVVNGASSNLQKIAAHEMGHTIGSSHTGCGDWMGPSGGGSTLCSSTASFFAKRAQQLPCVKQTCGGGGGGGFEPEEPEVPSPKPGKPKPNPGPQPNPNPGPGPTGGGNCNPRCNTCKKPRCLKIHKCNSCSGSGSPSPGPVPNVPEPKEPEPKEPNPKPNKPQPTPLPGPGGKCPARCKTCKGPRCLRNNGCNKC